MSIASSEKIFIDPKDEITFVVERVLSTSINHKLIIVVPQNSMLLSSMVSISILFRQLLKSKKLSIIVTEDNYGKIIAEKVGFIVVPKVSQINSNLWELAKSQKDELFNQIKIKKKELYDNLNTSDDEIPYESQTLEKDEIKKNNLENSLSENIYNTQIEKKDEDTSESLVKDQNEVNEKKEVSNKIDQQAKITTIEGIEVFGGQDIKLFLDNRKNDKIEDNEESIMRNSKIKKVNNIVNGSFTNKDFTKAVNNDNKIQNLLKRLIHPKRIQDPNERFEGISNNNKKNRLRALGLFLITMLVLLALITYVIVFQLSTLDITLKVKAENVSTSATITVNPSSTTISYNPLVIPGKIIKQSKISASSTGTADGSGKSGTKAIGVVRLINKTLNTINIKASTKLTATGSNLIYLFNKDTTVNAATTSNGIINATTLDDVGVTASDIGDNYNITGLTTNSSFVTDGYNQSQLQISRFVDFTGGTIQTFITVSKDNIDKLKATMLPDLQKRLNTNIKQLTPEGYKLLDASIQYNEATSTSVPAQDQKSVDKTFTLTEEYEASGIAVLNDDLVNAVKYLLINSSKSNNISTTLEVGDINDPIIDKVEKNNDIYILTISPKGSIKTKVTPNQMKIDIAGKSIQDANDYFHALDYIESYDVSFNPSFLPKFLQRVPTNTNKIHINVK